jgi:hypothetical protein
MHFFYLDETGCTGADLIGSLYPPGAMAAPLQFLTACYEPP